MSRFAHKIIIVHQKEMSTLFVFAQQKIQIFILQKHKMHLDIPFSFLYIITMTSAKTGISLHVGFTESNRLVEDCKPLLASHPGADSEWARFLCQEEWYRGNQMFSSLLRFVIDVESSKETFFVSGPLQKFRRYIEYEELHKVQRGLLSTPNESG